MNKYLLELTKARESAVNTATWFVVWAVSSHHARTVAIDSAHEARCSLGRSIILESDSSYALELKSQIDLVLDTLEIL